MEKPLVLRIPRSDDATKDLPMSTASAMIDGFVDDWKQLLAGIRYGGAGIEATVVDGRVVGMNLKKWTNFKPG